MFLTNKRIPNLSVVTNEKPTILLPQNLLHVHITRLAYPNRLITIPKEGATKMRRMIERRLARDESEHVERHHAQKGEFYFTPDQFNVRPVIGINGRKSNDTEISGYCLIASAITA